jgi:Na+/proline symporter
MVRGERVLERIGKRGFSSFQVSCFSTMSAQLNTVCATIYEDFLVKMLGVRVVVESRANVIMKCIVVVVGVVCVLLVNVVEQLKGIVQVSSRTLSSLRKNKPLFLNACFYVMHAQRPRR